MADINKNLKSICSFYASEWHLVTMLLPNLDQKINKGVKVTTILEKDLTKEMETLLTKLHLEDKKEIINIGWQKSNLEDIKQLVQNNDCIIINGTKEFIEKTREKIENNLLEEVLPKEICNNVENILSGNLDGVPEKYIPRLRCIPFSSLGKQNGMLLGIKADGIEVDFEEEKKCSKDVIIGVYDKSLTKKGEYRALIGLELT